MADDYKMVREVEDDAVVRVGDIVVQNGVRWHINGITTLENGDKRMASISVPDYHKARRSSGDAYNGTRRGREGRDAVAWQGYPANWPACACGLPAMDGHRTCGRAGCGGL